MTNKYIGLSYAFFLKGMKFFLKQKNCLVIFNLNFMQVPLIENAVFQKSSHKKYAFRAFGLNSFEIVFALLTKIII